MEKRWLVGQAIFFSLPLPHTHTPSFQRTRCCWMSTVSVSLLKQISPFQTSTDKIIRHSEHNSILYSATKGSSLVSLHLLSQGCDASIIMLSKRAWLERQEHSFHTLTVYVKWSALIFCQNGGTFSQRSPPDTLTTATITTILCLKTIFH